MWYSHYSGAGKFPCTKTVFKCCPSSETLWDRTVPSLLLLKLTKSFCRGRQRVGQLTFLEAKRFNLSRCKEVVITNVCILLTLVSGG